MLVFCLSLNNSNTDISSDESHTPANFATMAAKAICFPLAKHIQQLHNIFISPTTTPSQLSLLHSATDSPVNQNHYNGETNIFILAATLAHKVMKNHPFPDGNKRTSLLAADAFLAINGFKLQPDKARDGSGQALAEAQVKLCTDQSSVAEMAAYYESIAVPVGRKIDEVAT